MRAGHRGRVAPGQGARLGVGCLASMLALSLLTGCAYSKRLDKPIPLQPTGAIAVAQNENLSAAIDAIIVRDGPGSWSKNADWDEYLMRVRASADEPVEITRIAVVDSLGKRQKPSTVRNELEGKSKEVEHRYKDADLEVTAGMGGGLFVAGTVVGSASALAGLATVGSSGAAAGAAVAGAVVVAPVLMAAGLAVMFQEGRVAREIDRRSTVFPATVPADQELALDVFFPLAPAPERVEVRYRTSSGEHVLVIDTKAALAGLHLLPKDESPPNQADQAP